MTSRRLRVHPDILGVDLPPVFAFYREKDARLPRRFADDFDARLDFIERQPFAGRALFDAYRRVVLRDFPYLVAYAVDDTSIDVLAIVHGMRNPASIRALITGRE